MSLFNKILIANRGEIACRIIRTASSLGIKTVAVFSEADKNARHVNMADEAYLIGAAPSKDSYLNIEKIIATAIASQSDAIHPGYGFLSENPLFAKACEENGIVFIGPSSHAMKLMADKNLAKEKIKTHGIPTLPSYYDKQQTLAILLLQSKQIGFPVVLKAIAGGGGKGLRLVSKEEDFESAYHAVRREAKAYFNDERVIVEKYLQNARHIEVQILADHFNTVHHLYTRDCSIQRRHQKIIEEAPAPNIPQDLHEAITDAAVAVAKAIQYTNAGTVEFLVGQDDFYFMEMNTRLQVEHPVTEMITGLDIVEWQIRIAFGERLFSTTPKSKGHAIEIRLNAEDPERDFLPSSGEITYFKLPQANKHLRIDCGYQENDHINIYYDSLLAKLITWGENRSHALNRLQNALAQVEILGIRTNLSLLKNICDNENFKLTKFNTHFLQDEQIVAAAPLDEKTFCAIGLFFLCFKFGSFNPLDPYSPWHIHDGWQLFFPGTFTFHFPKNNITVNIQKKEEVYSVNVDGKCFQCTISQATKISENISQLDLIIDDRFYSAKIFNQQDKLELIFNHNTYFIEVDNNTDHQSQDQEFQLIAPMPGTLVALLVNSGQEVVKGDKLLVIEAMKMEHTLYAPKKGKVKQCYFKIGDFIKEGVELIEFEWES